MQVFVSANIQVVALRAARALTAVLGTAPSSQRARCEAAASQMMAVFMSPYRLINYLPEGPFAVLLRDECWQRATGPLGLVATVELLRACSATHIPLELVSAVSGALTVHMVTLKRYGNTGQRSEGWTKLLGSDSMQQYALEALQQLHSSRKDVSIDRTDSDCELSFLSLLLEAFRAGEMSQAALEAMLTNEGLLSYLRDGACGGLHGVGLTRTVKALSAAWTEIQQATIFSTGRPEAHRAMQSAMLGAVRQSTVLLQLRTVAPALRQRAVRRAQRYGFLMVCRPPILLLSQAPRILNDICGHRESIREFN